MKDSQFKPTDLFDDENDPEDSKFIYKSKISSRIQFRSRKGSKKINHGRT